MTDKIVDFIKQKADSWDNTTVSQNNVKKTLSGPYVKSMGNSK